MRLLIPARINLLGGWSDQYEWRGENAVVNVSIGWESFHSDWPHYPYPCVVDEGEFRTQIQGIGTGLGISSIRAAALTQAKYRRPLTPEKIAEKSWEFEQKDGTRGGWQDAIGALVPGFKLIQYIDGAFRIQTTTHPVINHLILFDTGTRHASPYIGNRVRLLIGNNRHFQRALAENVDDATQFFRLDSAEAFAQAAIRGFQRLTLFVAQMNCIMPKHAGLWGSMMLGAGGAGFGVAFAKEPDERKEIIDEIQNQGFRAYIPVELAMKWDEERKHMISPPETKHIPRAMVTK